MLVLLNKSSCSSSCSSSSLREAVQKLDFRQTPKFVPLLNTLSLRHFLTFLCSTMTKDIVSFDGFPNMFCNAITTEHCNHGPVHPIILYRDIQDSRDDEKIESDLVHSSPECVSDANVNKIFHFQNILSVETFHLGSLCTVSEQN